MGYRVESIKVDINNKSKDYSKGLFQAGVGYNLDESQIFANVESTYRNPLVDEYYNSWTNSYNEELKPQEAVNYELGIKNDNYTASIYEIDTDNEIFYNPSTYTNTNIDSTKRVGIEGSVKMDLKGFKINQSIRLSKATVESGEYKGKEIPWTSKVGYNLSVEKELGEVLFQWNSRYIGERYSISDWDNKLGKVGAAYYRDW